MTKRIESDRVGYTGYSQCDGISTYDLDCQCCQEAGVIICTEEYLNIPTKGSKSVNNAPWDQNHNTYIAEGPAVPDTSRHIWIVTEPTWGTVGDPGDPPITPPECVDNESNDYDFLETDYIDVPPVRTRGISYPSPASDAVKQPPPCIRCYDESPSSYPPLSTVSYDPAGGGAPVEVQNDTDAEGRILPRTLPRSAVSDKYFQVDPNGTPPDLTPTSDADCKEVTFIYCPRFKADGVKAEDQCGYEYIGVEYKEVPGNDEAEQFYLTFNVGGIPVGNGSSITHVLGKDGSNCLYWIEVTDCPTTP